MLKTHLYNRNFYLSEWLLSRNYKSSSACLVLSVAIVGIILPWCVANCNGNTTTKSTMCHILKLRKRVSPKIHEWFGYHVTPDKLVYELHLQKE